jgi:RND family efflux transporter MFP subunit
MKSIAALALMAAIAYFISPRVEKLIGGAVSTASSGSPAQAATEGDAPPAPFAPPAPAVVGHVVANADLALSREYIGRVEPIQAVLVKPRVSGQIESVHFKEGTMVKEGDVLFTLDSAQHQATVQLRRADLAKAEASLSRAVKYNNRLQSADKRGVSASDADMAASDVQQNKAAVEQAKAALKLAQIDLEFTKITAPISGRIGRAATKGNYVTPSGDPLASIVQIDPIRVSYALPDKNYMDQINEYRSKGDVYETTLALADGAAYPERGERDFEANEMDASTATIKIYLRFKNSGGALVPGSMVRVLTKPVKARVAPVVPQEAILSDSGGDFVYVIDENDVARRRDVNLGAEIGSSREITSGLAAGEKVITRGIQAVRPESPVKPSYPLEGAPKGAADLARESGYDLPAVE